ncbi:MAG: hypothetical protein FVQ80_14415 [Planctomycetes bacterium]|nr:hypothetical protein [Planctomycetota bacterium]
MFDKEDIIYSYTRSQAIEDGSLIDVTQMAKEAGIKYPVAVTKAVWDTYITPDEELISLGQSINGRLWDVLWIFRTLASHKSRDTLFFRVYFLMDRYTKPKFVTLKALIHPGDNLEPVITIMLPGED